MVGKIYITSTGYDPQKGKSLNDPYLGPQPTLGACRPDIRRNLQKGDHIFVVSGKIAKANQYVMGGFEIESKISAQEAYDSLPEHRLSLREDGQLEGNIIVDSYGNQHKLDHHKKFESRIQNYIIGKSPICLLTDEEIEYGREHTVEALCEIFHRKGRTPIEIIGRCSRLSEIQIQQLRGWLTSLKR